MNKPILVTHHLEQHITRLLHDAQGIYLLLAFMKSSGVQELLPALDVALKHQAEIKILTGDYLFITDPDALETLLQLGAGIEMRMWLTSGETFHPKAYLFESQGHTDIVVGSSNLSRSALTTGVEWNLLVEEAYLDNQDPITEFMRLFYADQTIPVNRVTVAEYRRRRDQYVNTFPHIRDAWTESAPGPQSDSNELPPLEPETNATPEILLRPAQKEALDALLASQEEGHRRGMVVLPTGLGKTYVAAFFARRFGRILFVAHRDEILHQAAKTFRNIMPERTQAFYTGYEKGLADIVFASVFTLSSRRNRVRFLPGQFDLIVVDEFHHAAAPSYDALLSYFHPQFLLGLTATPERMDNKDVYALCDGNLVYQVTLADAINQQWLVPFHYYGIYDPTDYQAIPWRGTHYDEDILARVQMKASFANMVFDGWLEHHNSRTLAFCAGVEQAHYFAQYFTERGITACALTATTAFNVRRETLKAFQEGRIAVIFSVNLFNEGLDIPATDTILLIRPTDSSVIFLQQIGRGLRPFSKKSYCTIIDFVGNYRNADHRLALLGINNVSAALRDTQAISKDLPAGCMVHLDLAVIDVLKKLRERRTPRKTRLLEALHRVRDELGRRPSYLEFHLKSGADSRIIRQEFHSYVGFLEEAGDLSLVESHAYAQVRGWLETVEKTAMSQSYKMVLLHILLARGESQWDMPITASEASEPFYRYLHDNSLWMKERQRQKIFQGTYDAKAVTQLIVRNPMHYLATSHPTYFSLSQDTLVIHPGTFDEKARAFVREWTQEIIDYRLYVYFRSQSQ
ncbi:DEAD/DEAH box helicase family protein [Sulfobacillus thermosulfidooxidans]|uniref:DEAD/DEAH box helicase family protein n=1 Tax=Sulfobacillus thermosulfidooxidans TaxID=28034 RepID=UPI0006B4FF42|nr:DEAD/DEAH box helicase family protein [Sulfobacillus thermosulfidooxidans]